VPGSRPSGTIEEPADESFGDEPREVGDDHLGDVTAIAAGHTVRGLTAEC
jgi:hypothetical protein